MEPIEPWLDQQYRHAASAMLRSISPVGIVKERSGFGQTVRPRKGAIVASPVLASYDPDPDYFFHWYRDSAVIIDALRLLYGDGSIGATACEHLADFLGQFFSSPSGRPAPDVSNLQATCRPARGLDVHERSGARRGDRR